MQLYTAQLDNWLIKILDISDNLSMSIVKHEYAGTDGAYIQHMGNHPREISFKSYWFGAEEQGGEFSPATYVNHADFLNSIADSSISHRLIHPKYGIIYGYVESASIVHDDTQDYVTIDIKYIQKDIQTLALVPSSSTLSTDAMTILGINNDLIATGTDMQALGMSSLLGKTIDASQTIASQINNVSQKVRGFCNELDTNLNKFDTFLHDITAPLNAIDASIHFIADIPSRVIGSINNSVNRILTTLSDISNLPAQFTNNLTLSCESLYATITGEHAAFFQTHFRSITALRINNAVAGLLQTDEDSRNKEWSKEGKLSFDKQGNRINKVTFNPFMTTNELNSVMALTRKYSQKSVIANRSNQDVKDISAALGSFVNDVKLKKLTVKTINVSDMPLYELLQQLGLPYAAADRVLALNPQVTNPTFLTGAIRVYAS